jgi:hypothetical protein
VLQSQIQERNLHNAANSPFFTSVRTVPHWSMEQGAGKRNNPR